MPDISMCAHGSCSLSEGCYRHQNSGTKPTEYRQAYSNFQGSWDRYLGKWICDDYIPVDVKAVE